MISERIQQMSFSGEVKKELCEQISPARHCKLAEISAIIAFCGKLVVDKDQTLILKLQTESTILTKKIFLLLKQVFRVSAELTTRAISAKKNLYELTLSAEETGLVLAACKLSAAEEEKNGYVLGYTKNYCPVKWHGILSNQPVEIEIIDIDDEGLIGK